MGLEDLAFKARHGDPVFKGRIVVQPSLHDDVEKWSVERTNGFFKSDFDSEFTGANMVIFFISFHHKTSL